MYSVHNKCFNSLLWSTSPILMRLFSASPVKQNAFFLSRTYWYWCFPGPYQTIFFCPHPPFCRVVWLSVTVDYGVECTIRFWHLTNWIHSQLRSTGLQYMIPPVQTEKSSGWVENSSAEVCKGRISHGPFVNRTRVPGLANWPHDQLYICSWCLCSSMYALSFVDCYLTICPILLVCQYSTFQDPASFQLIFWHT